MTDSGFWRRMAAKVPGSIKAVAAPGSGGQRTRQLSFSEFDSELSDAWSENEDEFLRASTRTQARANSSAPVLTSGGVTQHMQGGKPVMIDATLLESPIKEGSSPDAEDGPTAQSQITPASSPRASAPSSSLPTVNLSSSAGASAAAPVPASTAAAAAAAATTTAASASATNTLTSASASSSSAAASLQRLALNMLNNEHEGSDRRYSSDRPPTPPTPTTPMSFQEAARSDRDAVRFEKFNKLLTAPLVDLEALRQLSWSGIPANMRPTVWGLLSGYLPANQERREETLALKRTEYKEFVSQYFNTRSTEAQHNTYHQIHIDVLRTNPAIITFQNIVVQEMFERILYIWAIRHPGSGYVQGINDLVTPFFAVFMSPFVDDIENCDISLVPENVRDAVEADSYWCMNKLLDGIQDNYTFAHPGIQKNLKALKELVSRIDAGLQEHLEKYNVEYLQFAFRWMNCLLMREMPLQCTVRLWDTYHSEVDGFATFHLYVCAAFLRTFSKQIIDLHDFQHILLFMQSLPTQNWSDKEVELILAEAYRWKYMFHDARKHLS